MPINPGARRWTIRLLLLAIVLTATAIVVVYGVGLRMGSVGRLDSLAPGSGVYLLVGSDSRENLPDDLEGRFGDFAGARADVIILLQVVGDRAQLLSIPRDLRVEIPGRGVGRVNAAYAYGGPDLLAETVSRATGIPIGHYLEVEFGGFAAIVDALGGIELDFPYPARDLKSGLAVEEAGTQVVDGATALAYVRSRTYEEYRDGRWRLTDGGDIARTQRQQEVLVEIMDRASSPAGLVRSPWVLFEASGHLSADAASGVGDLARLGLAFRRAATTEKATLPVAGRTEGGVAYVVMRQPEADAVLEAFRRGDPLP